MYMYHNNHVSRLFTHDYRWELIMTPMLSSMTTMKILVSTQGEEYGGCSRYVCSRVPVWSRTPIHYRCSFVNCSRLYVQAIAFLIIELDKCVCFVQLLHNII